MDNLKQTQLIKPTLKIYRDTKPDYKRMAINKLKYYGNLFDYIVANNKLPH